MKQYILGVALSLIGGLIGFSMAHQINQHIELNEARYRLGTRALEKQKEVRKEGRIVTYSRYGLIIGEDIYELHTNGTFYLNGRQLK